jgi:serine/threonine protein kinase
MPVGPGLVLGRYRLLERVGSGGMSDVWRAEDETLRRIVAVKIIHEAISNEREYAERFLREARLVAGLEHSNILPVYDFGSCPVDGLPVSYLVMPLVTAGSLKDKIKGPLSPPVALPWLAAVAAALDHAHAKGILHRDVKPANVLLDNSGRPLLADFGLARSAESSSGLTVKGTVLGTPTYMAPEQATGKDVGPAVDQYALAVTAFQLLTGVAPFRADSPLAVLHQQIATPPPPLSSMLPSAGSEADAILARALAKDPAKRYATCGEFVRALAAAFGISLTMPSASYGPSDVVPSSQALPPPAMQTAPTRRAELDVEAPTVHEPAPAGPAPPTEILPPPLSAAGRRPMPPPPPPLVVPEKAPGASGIASPDSARTSAPPAGGAGRFIAAAALVVAIAAGLAFAFTRLRARGGKDAGETSAVPTPLAAAPTPLASEASPSTATVEAPTAPPAERATSVSPTAAPGESVPTAIVTVPTSASEAAALRREAARVAREPHAKPTPVRIASSDVRGREREPAADVPRESESARPIPREPLLSPQASTDSELYAAYRELDTTKKGGRLERADFVSALGEVRRVFAMRQTPEVQFLDAYTRAGVAFADGDDAQAWTLLHRAVERPPHEGRTLRFVRSMAFALGPRPGVDGGWVMALAFADVRGDLGEELRKADERAPQSPRVVYARALQDLAAGRGREARRLARRACELGLPDACRM